MCNVTAHVFANAAARMTTLRDIFTIEILYKPSVPNNITNLHAFDDDKQILPFMVNIDVFKDATIDEDVHKKVSARHS